MYIANLKIVCYCRGACLFVKKRGISLTCKPIATVELPVYFAFLKHLIELDLCEILNISKLYFLSDAVGNPCE